MNKQEFIIDQLKPYFLNRDICGWEGSQCSYLTSEGKMCVAGKNMIDPKEWTNCNNSIDLILADTTQAKVFKPESCDILNTNEWQLTQRVHDNLARPTLSFYSILTAIESLERASLTDLTELKELLKNL